MRFLPFLGAVLHVTAIATTLVGCKDDTTPVMPRFDPTLSAGPTLADTWLAFPFPADHRRTADGHVRFKDFPNPYGVVQLAEWLQEAEATLDGFSVGGATYFAFDGPIDATTLPTTPEGFLGDDSPVLLVDVTQGAEEFGERSPIRTHYYAAVDATSATYVAPNTLALGPAWGFPLRERHTYAVIVRDSLRAEGGAAIGRPALLRALLEDRSSPPSTNPRVDASLYATLRSEWSGLRTYLAGASIDPKSIVVATVFTTQHVTRELEAVADQIAADPTPPTMTSGFDPQGGGKVYTSSNFMWSSTSTTSFATYRGRYVAPNYQEGTLPYENSGGALHFVNDKPTPVVDETLDFVLTVPTAPPDPPRGCYPIVMYGHGTSGSRNSFRNDGTAGRLAARGMAGISIDMPLHGLRAQGQAINVSLLTFNFTNASAFRSNFRQGAIDLFSLTRFVRESLAVSASDSHTGQTISFCTDHVGFMGHSQGGLTGSLAIPFLPDVDTFMLSGAGGSMGITLKERKDVVDFEAFLELVFQIPAEEEYGEEHPITTLVQTLADVSDPAPYARYWNSDTSFRTPANVMLTNGKHDEATPYRAAISLALAGHLPVTTPVVIPIPDYAILDIDPATPPYQANATGKTTAFLQFIDDLPIADADTHFLVFYRPEAIDSSMHFLSTGTNATGIAAVRRNPTADAN